MNSEELNLTIGILILGRLECGAMPFKQWFKLRLKSNINMFSSIGGLNSSDVKFLSYHRFMTILKFLCTGPINYVPRKSWKKSTALAYREQGGYFMTGNSRILDYDSLYRPFLNYSIQTQCRFTNVQDEYVWTRLFQNQSREKTT